MLAKGKPTCGLLVNDGGVGSLKLAASIYLSRIRKEEILQMDGIMTIGIVSIFRRTTASNYEIVKAEPSTRFLYSPIANRNRMKNMHVWLQKPLY